MKLAEIAAIVGGIIAAGIVIFVCLLLAARCEIARMLDEDHDEGGY